MTTYFSTVSPIVTRKTYHSECLPQCTSLSVVRKRQCRQLTLKDRTIKVDRVQMTCTYTLPISSVGLRMFWLCTRTKFVARGQALNTTHWLAAVAVHVIVCRYRSSWLPWKPRALLRDILVTCQVAAKIWIQIFQTSLACRNNHRRNGVRPRKSFPAK
jgi:hypothetical protein